MCWSAAATSSIRQFSPGVRDVTLPLSVDQNERRLFMCHWSVFVFSFFYCKSWFRNSTFYSDCSTFDTQTTYTLHSCHRFGSSSHFDFLPPLLLLLLLLPRQSAVFLHFPDWAPCFSNNVTNKWCFQVIFLPFINVTQKSIRRPTRERATFGHFSADTSSGAMFSVSDCPLEHSLVFA